MFPGFDGLMTLSRREGVDIRPTLLRVLTDLYVQTPSHTDDEERQFVELASRLIDQVDDATRAAVRARLSIYPRTPRPILEKLVLRRPNPGQRIPLARSIKPAELPVVAPPKPPSEAELRMAPTLSMQPNDASEINAMFFAASSSERMAILRNLADTPLKPSTRIPTQRAARAVETLEMAAFAVDAENFTLELGDALMLPTRIAEQVVRDPGGEPLACATKALGMPGQVFERVLMFLDPMLGSSVTHVYRLSRLYGVLGERTALIMVAAWRGSTLALTRAKYRPSLYDDEHHRARSAAPQSRPAAQAPGVGVGTRNNSRGSSGK
ncbi:MAG: hypothetical protein JWQ17_2204 [Tardiphaga sp.]|nr:hypothetical protein [Tardiphaga sp.]